MVRLKNLKCTGLFSYAQETFLEFSNNTVIVGPNNSGKSNLLRILKLFVDTFYYKKRLQDSEISYGGVDPMMEIELELTGNEPDIVLDFLSFYTMGNNRDMYFHEFENREILKKLLTTLNVKLSWQREISGYGSEAFVIIEFKKIGLKLFNSIYSGLRVSNKVLSHDELMSPLEKKKLNDILGDLRKVGVAKRQISKTFESVQNGYLDLDYLMYVQNSKLSNKAKQTLGNVSSFLDLRMDGNQQFSFVELFGAILKKGIVYSSEGRSNLSRTLLDCAKELQINRYRGYEPEPTNDKLFDEKLEEQAMTKSLEYVNEINTDGSNLPQFLFSLKNSPRYSDIEKFDKIKNGFEQIFHLEDLSVDILLEFEDTKRNTNWNSPSDKPPKYSRIVIIDKKIGKHFPLNQVGSGIKEVIYLLTTAYGIKNSVVMLDEPASSLHPPMMRAVMRHLENSNNENQFIVITHSSELLTYELFEAKGQVHYVKKLNRISHIKSLSGQIKTAFEKDKPKFKYMIDMRIFFGKCIILAEGESDKNLLTGVAQFFETNELLNINTQDIIIVSANGKTNFPKYRQYLDAYDVNYIILADNDANKDIFRKEKWSYITKEGIDGTGPIFLIKNKDLEHLMMEIDAKIFNNLKSTMGDSKPIVALEFAERLKSKNPSALNPIKDLLQHAIDMVNN
jgi:predicted ATP-dependent endonuclease of OLD family